MRELSLQTMSIKIITLKNYINEFKSYVISKYKLILSKLFHGIL